MEISRLPHDVLFDILLRLPVKPLIRFSLSSKQYLSLIHHPHFINRQTRSKINPSSPQDNFLLLSYYHSYSKSYSLCSFTDGGRTLTAHKRFQPSFKCINGDDFAKIVGSSNGLVCLSDTKTYPGPGDSIILWNVIFGRYKKLPNPYLSTHLHVDGFSHVSFGFGYVLETNDFKVVQILSSFGLGKWKIPDVLVYSMELNTWRKIEANIPLCPDNIFSNSNVYVNGAVHWLVYSYKKSLVGDFSKSIISFDMRGEVFKELGLPNIRRNADTYGLQMSASACGETLSVSLKVDNRWEVWLMKEYGVVDSWMRQFSIAGEQFSCLWKVMDSTGDVLLEMRSRNFRNLVLRDAESKQIKNLVLCDIENKNMNDLGIDPLPGVTSIVTYTPSLNLLDGGEKVNYRPKRKFGTENMF